MQTWLAAFCSDILNTASLSKLFKNTKIIATLKPEKQGTDATHYRLILVLNTTYKFLERLIVNPIQPEIKKIKSNPSKTDARAFHLYNRQADREQGYSEAQFNI